jgi:hypothetical protein
MYMKKTTTKCRSHEQSYAWQEYGTTLEQLCRFEKRVNKRIALERKRGTIKRFSGDLEKDIVAG